MINEYAVHFIDGRPPLEVVAADVELVAGALAFRDEGGNVSQVIAAGTWLRLRCTASAENMGEMARWHGVRREVERRDSPLGPPHGEWRHVR